MKNENTTNVKSSLAAKAAYRWTQLNLHKQPRGFTFIELLVSVLIIGILAAGALPQYQKAVDKVRVVELLPLVKNLKAQQEIFFLVNGYYAADCEELGGELPAGFDDQGDKNLFKFNKGAYNFYLKCNNGNRVMGIVAGGNVNTHIEMFFDHYCDEDVSPAVKGLQGKSFCSAQSKDIGKEVFKEGESYWL